MRERAAEMSSPEARQARLNSLWNAAQARVAPIRAAMASAAASSRAAAASAIAATAAAAVEARRRIDEALRQRAQQRRGEREARLEQAERQRRVAEGSGSAVAQGQEPAVDAWQRIELQRVQERVGDLDTRGAGAPSHSAAEAADRWPPIAFEEQVRAGPFSIPSSPFATTTYRIDATASLRTLAQDPSIAAQLSSLKFTIPWPPPLLGGWSIDLGKGILELTHSTPWLTPISTPGNAGASAQLRWTASWGIGSYEGEFGIRSTGQLQSRLLMDGLEVSRASATIDATSRLRPQNMLLYGAVAVGVTALAFGVPAFTAAATAAAGGLSIAIGRLTTALGH